MAPQTATMAGVKRTLRVGVPIDRAFRVLTEKMGTWWPASHHIGKTPFAEIVVEPHVGGRWFERGQNGEECQWGEVLLWDPPKQLVVSWQLQADWHFSPDKSRASEVSFAFFAEGPEATRLEFEHRHIERHREGWENIRKGVDSPGGWTGVLTQFELNLTGQNNAGTISQAERDYAAEELEDSLKVFLESTKNLSAAQWKFKPAADCWSAAEAAEHTGYIEDLCYRLITERSLKGPAEPEKRKAIRYSDPGILRVGTEREEKLKAPEPVQPTGRWGVPEELLKNIKGFRARSIEFIKTTQADLRNHFLDHPYFGTLDAYQWILLVSAHMRRHTDQIEKGKSHPNFPKD